MKYISTFLSIFLLLVLSVNVFAQEQDQEFTILDYGFTQEQADSLPEEVRQQILSQTPEEYFQNFAEQSGPQLTPEQESQIFSCSEFVERNGVQVNVMSRVTDLVSGTKATFTGQITNQTSQPVNEGTLFVRVINNQTGTVDQFIARDNLYIPAMSSIPVQFDWKIPATVISGEYKIASFVTIDKKFNVLGLTYSENVLGNTFDFTVSGEDGGVYIDSTSLNVNENPHTPNVYPDVLPQDEDIKLSFAVENTTDRNQNAKVTWKIYNWDSINPENLIRTVEENISIVAGESRDLELNLSDNHKTVYHIVAKVEYKDSKSMATFRVAKEDVNSIMTNFVGVKNYPIERGEQNTLFACLSNLAGPSVIDGNKVTIEIKDSMNNVLESYQYEGPITSAPMAIKKDFTAMRTLSDFSIYTKVWNNGQLVDESEVEYKCDSLGLDNCVNETGSMMYVWYILGGVILLILIVLVAKSSRRSDIPRV